MRVGRCQGRHAASARLQQRVRELQGGEGAQRLCQLGRRADVAQRELAPGLPPGLQHQVGAVAAPACGRRGRALALDSSVSALS